jgi:hypothetical protein
VCTSQHSVCGKLLVASVAGWFDDTRILHNKLKHNLAVCLLTIALYPISYILKSYILYLKCPICRVGQNHIYTVYVRYFWQGNYQIYGHIRCIYTVLANPIHTVFLAENSQNAGSYTVYIHCSSQPYVSGCQALSHTCPGWL